MSNTTVAITVSDEVANKLFNAYVGLSPQRKAVVDKAVVDRKITLQQATFEEISYPRVILYHERGCKEQEKVMASAKMVLKAQGKTDAQIEAFLNG